MLSQARLEIDPPISLFLVTSLVILRFAHDSLTIPMPIPLSLCLFPYPYVLPNLPFASLPFSTIFSYQLICLAGIAVRPHCDFPELVVSVGNLYKQ